MSDDVHSTGRYEHAEEQEFWIGEVRGRFFTIQFGKIGTTGHKASREFPNKERAMEFLTRKLQDKLDEGYTLI